MEGSQLCSMSYGAVSRYLVNNFCTYSKNIAGNAKHVLGLIKVKMFYAEKNTDTLEVKRQTPAGNFRVDLNIVPNKQRIKQ